MSHGLIQQYFNDITLKAAFANNIDLRVLVTFGEMSSSKLLFFIVVTRNHRKYFIKMFS